MKLLGLCQVLDHKNSNMQGCAGLGKAIAHFTSLGYIVCLPLNDSQPYDLVIDDDSILHRVQVKTSKQIRRDKYVVGLRTTYRHTRENFDPSKYDLLFIALGDGREYLIPTSEVKTKTSLTIGNDEFKEFLL